MMNDDVDEDDVRRDDGNCDNYDNYEFHLQDVSQVLRPTGRKLMLVSKGAVMLRIKRDDFFRYSTKHTLRQARKAVQELE